MLRGQHYPTAEFVPVARRLAEKLLSSIASRIRVAEFHEADDLNQLAIGGGG
jgi:hypothetical protein